VLGLSALVASSEIVFNVVKYAGAAYLIWMGITAIRTKALAVETPIESERAKPGRLFMQGLIVNVLNPKVGLFFIAFLPQFIEPERGGSTVQVLVLGGVFLTIAVVSDMVYALASGSIGTWLSTREQIARQRDRFTGVVYILLGAFAAISGSGSARNR
jgi:threonine/homoserine/homoserine lactone efflux protein